MRLLLLLAGLTLAWLPSVIRASSVDHVLDLGNGQAVLYTLPEGWQKAPPEAPANMELPGTTVRFIPKNGANAECICVFLTVSGALPAEPAALEQMLLATTEGMIADSVEGRAEPREFKTPHARGYAVAFTDKKLVGQPPVAGDYKNATVVLLRLAGGIIVTATLLCDDPKGPEAAAMMALVRSLGPKPSASNTI